MMWEPGCREVPATDPPDYQPDDDDWADLAEHFRAESWAASRELSDAEQDEAERAYEAWYQPTEGDRGGPDV